MLRTRLLFRRALVACLALAWLALGPYAHAYDTRFSEFLTSAEKTTIGIDRLTDEQRADLDLQVARELSLARQGGTVAFAKTFSERRTPEQIASAGLDKLSKAELAELDAAIARSMARGPTALVHLRGPRANGDAVPPVQIVKPKPEIHGEVTMVVGASSGGGSFYGGSATAIYHDPKHNITISITYAEYHAKGPIVIGPMLPDDPTLR